MDVIPSLTHVPGYVKGTMHMVDRLLPWSWNKIALRKLLHSHLWRIITIVSAFWHQFLVSYVKILQDSTSLY